MTVDVIEADDVAPVVRRYVELGLRLGQHHGDIVDAYYGPPQWRDRIEATPTVPIDALVEQARDLLAELDADDTAAHPLDPQRRRWLRSQTVGLHTVAEKLAGVEIDYLDEVQRCYGVRPERISLDEVASAHRALQRALGATEATLSEHMAALRGRHVIAVDRLRGVIDNLAQEFRARTKVAFGLPDGESVNFDLVTDKPYSGFNFYQGDFTSLVTINTDLPVLSTSIAHLISHEAYPGHHTEGCHKEQGLVRSAKRAEQTIALIGTPSCLMAEGLADLGLEALMGPEPLAAVASMLHDAGVHYEVEAVAAMAEFSEVMARARGTLALHLHEDGAPVEAVVRTAMEWFVVDEDRATQMVRFITDPTWRAYVFCYAEGYRLCRSFVNGDAARFARLLDEPLTPEDLAMPGGR